MGNRPAKQNGHAPANKTLEKTVRLLHVIVQPVFLVEEGDQIIGTATADQRAVFAANWPDGILPVGELAAAIAARLNADPPAPAPKG
jgi:hypothetical protein